MSTRELATCVTRFRMPASLLASTVIRKTRRHVEGMSRTCIRAVLVSCFAFMYVRLKDALRRDELLDQQLVQDMGLAHHVPEHFGDVTWGYRRLSVEPWRVRREKNPTLLPGQRSIAGS